MSGMFRAQNRQHLTELADTQELVPEQVSVKDSYGHKLIVSIRPDGDINLSCFDGKKLASVTFAGAGGGDARPLTKEALRLLVLAMKEEGGDVRTL